MTNYKLLIKAFKSTPLHCWFTKSWWQYLLDKRVDRNYCSRIHRVLCRAAGHPEGVWWYSSGCEPDQHCKDCGDDLG